MPGVETEPKYPGAPWDADLIGLAYHLQCSPCHTKDLIMETIASVVKFEVENLLWFRSLQMEYIVAMSVDL